MSVWIRLSIALTALWFMFSSSTRCAFMPLSGWTALKYFSISKEMPPFAVRQTGWETSFLDASTSATLSPSVSLTKVSSAVLSFSSFFSSSFSMPRSSLRTEQNFFSL